MQIVDKKGINKHVAAADLEESCLKLSVFTPAAANSSVTQTVMVLAVTPTWGFT